MSQTNPRTRASTRQSHRRYRAFEPVPMSARRWPDRTIDGAPRWCSVDLRDGNQALAAPMGVERKLRMFEKLVAIGFKEIEVGFPSASQTEFEFLRRLIEEDRIPDDVAIQILAPAREALIRRSFEALEGAREVIFHLYNSTSLLQRQVVFQTDRAGVIQIALQGTRVVRALADRMRDTRLHFEYSPESFTATELEFSVEICEAVMDQWGASADQPVILNLPATVEMSTPNVYADQIEWFSRAMRHRDHALLSVHPHNDRGTAVAAAELALMAGAERVEGTLFGNGERTGNVDVVTLALNLMSQGVDPELELADLPALVELSQYCTQLPVHPRHPYAGELVFTAFSGSHQDAIHKGLRALEGRSDEWWEVPYLPVDPGDLGRCYEPVIRVNSQSGKGGVAYLMKVDHGIELPPELQRDFSRVVQTRVERSGREISSADLMRVFEAEYLEAAGPWRLLEHALHAAEGGADRIEAVVLEDGVPVHVHGTGQGPLAAFAAALESAFGLALRICRYSEHAVGEGAGAEAIAFIGIEARDRAVCFGVGRHRSIVAASLEALIGALNQSTRC